MTQDNKIEEIIKDVKAQELEHGGVDEHVLRGSLCDLERTAREETAKAYGGCSDCRGKGYSTQKHQYTSHKDFGDESTGTWEGNPIIPCECERGEQIKEVMRISVQEYQRDEEQKHIASAVELAKREERQRIREWVNDYLTKKGRKIRVNSHNSGECECNDCILADGIFMARNDLLKELTDE